MSIVSWTKKYEPTDLDEMVLNPDVRTTLDNIIRNPQSVILYGSSGVGKGTFTNIFQKKTGCVMMWKNASNETGIDMVRNSIIPFADSASVKTFFKPSGSNMSGIEGTHINLKCVSLNEAEYLSKEAQASLREVIERSEKRCKFIFMTNNLNKIDNAIKSRCILVEIKKPPIPDILRLLEGILEKEEVEYDSEKLINFVHRNYPDIRRIINDLQGHCNQDRIVIDDQLTLNHNLDRVLLDLKMYMTFYNKEKREIYESLKDHFEFPVSERQFYYLISGNGGKKVSDQKKSGVINCVLEKIPVKDWLEDYMRMTD
jgi:DNA polymerase III delta prime subunit